LRRLPGPLQHSSRIYYLEKSTSKVERTKCEVRKYLNVVCGNFNGGFGLQNDGMKGFGLCISPGVAWSSVDNQTES
jgi:hypothetical protein